MKPRLTTYCGLVVKSPSFPNRNSLYCLYLRHFRNPVVTHQNPRAGCAGRESDLSAASPEERPDQVAKPAERGLMRV